MTTTRQLARLAGISEQTVRNYSRDYSDLLSPQARGDAGPRLFSDQDVQLLCTVASLRREDVPRAEIMARLQRGDIVVDATPNHNTPQQAPKAGQGDALAVLDVQPMLLARFEAIERRLDAQQRGEMLWHIGTGIWIGMVLMGAIFFAVWLVVAY